MPYDRFYSKLMDFSVWIYTNILRFGKYENESVVKFAAGDKNSNVLANSRVKYSLIIKPQSVNKSNWEKHKSSISNLLNIDSNVIQKKYILYF